MNHRDKITNSLSHGFPNAKWVCGDTYETLGWMSDDIPKPTEQEFNNAVTAWQAEYDAQEYVRKRQAEYPSIVELTVALYDTADKAALVAKRAAVKTKWPKNNTGPVE